MASPGWAPASAASSAAAVATFTTRVNAVMPHAVGRVFRAGGDDVGPMGFDPSWHAAASAARPRRESRFDRMTTSPVKETACEFAARFAPTMPIND